MTGLQVIPRVNVGFIGKMQKSKVCRCLFGVPDHDSVRKDLKEMLKKDRLETSERWNFDILREEPLAGRYEWEVIEEDKEYIPEFYKKGYISNNKVRVRRQTTNNNNNITVNSDSGSDSDSGSSSVQRALQFSSESSDSDVQCDIKSLNSSQNVCNTDLSGVISEENKRPSGPLVQTSLNDFMRKRKRAASSDVSSAKNARLQ